MKRLYFAVLLLTSHLLFLPEAVFCQKYSVNSHQFPFKTDSAILKGLKKEQIQISADKKEIQVTGLSSETGSISNTINCFKSRGMVVLTGTLSSNFSDKDAQIGVYLHARNGKGNTIVFSNSLDIIKDLGKERQVKIKMPFTEQISKVDYGCFVQGRGQILVKDLSVSISDGEFDQDWENRFIKNFGGDTLSLHALATLGKVWGYLKYQHPDIGTNGIDWDSKLISKMKDLFEAKTSNEYKKTIQTFILESRALQKCDTCLKQFPDSLLLNVNPTLFTENLISGKAQKRLLNLKTNRPVFDNYFVKYSSENVPNPKFINELSYKSMKLPAMDYRLLALFRYWNAIEYFYPYKFLIQKNWDKVLEEMIPIFIAARNPDDYHLALLKMNAEIGDGHASYVEGITQEQLPLLLKSQNGNSEKTLPLPFKVSAGPFLGLVTDSDSSFAEKSGLKLGDVVISINNIETSNSYKLFSNFISASNIKNKQAQITKFNLLAWARIGQDSVVNVVAKRGTEFLSLKFKYNLPSYSNYFTSNSKNINNQNKNLNATRLLKDSVLYIDPSKVDNVSADTIIKKLSSMKGIIIDFRKYPKYSIGKILPMLVTNGRPGINFQWMRVDYPGVLSNSAIQYFSPKTQFFGDVRILIDETSISQSEFWAMLFRQASDKVLVIGDTSAGADGDVSSITVPGGVKLSFSGIRVRYADGRETQKLGIEPDIKVMPSIMDIIKENDVILSKALETIK